MGTYMYIQGVPVVPLKLTRRRKAIVVVQSLSHVQPFVALWTAAGRASQSFSISQSLLKFMSVESLPSSNHFTVGPFSSCFYILSTLPIRTLSIFITVI